jgi:hypothetical protein
VLQKLVPAAILSGGLEGFAVIRADRAAEIAVAITRAVPGLSLPSDGKAYPLPAAAQVPGHVVARQDAIAVAVGANSASQAIDALQGKPQPAPLVVAIIDYARYSDLLGGLGAQLEDARNIMKLLGIATMQLLVDDRGFVTWMAIENR